MLETDFLKNIITDILKDTPQRPFLCLPMSAFFYAVLKDKHEIETELVTGDLSYEGQYIFKQDFSISKSAQKSLQEWAGHAWVEYQGLVYDLSFFRTLYSDQFTKPCKDKILKYFGQGRGCLIGEKQQLEKMGLVYNKIDRLDDEMATGIIKGYETLLQVSAN